MGAYMRCMGFFSASLEISGTLNRIIVLKSCEHSRYRMSTVIKHHRNKLLLFHIDRPMKDQNRPSIAS